MPVQGSGLVAQYHGVAGGVQTGEDGVAEYDVGGSDVPALAAEQANTSPYTISHKLSTIKHTPWTISPKPQTRHEP